MENPFEVIILLAGAVLAVTRLRDYTLGKKMKNMFMRATCRVHLQYDFYKEKNESLNTFLTTSLNTELVITILKGITILGASTSDNIDNFKESEMKKVRQTSTIEIPTLYVMNVKRWEVQREASNSTKQKEETNSFKKIKEAKNLRR